MDHAIILYRVRYDFQSQGFDEFSINTVSNLVHNVMEHFTTELYGRSDFQRYSEVTPRCRCRRIRRFVLPRICGFVHLRSPQPCISDSRQNESIARVSTVCRCDSRETIIQDEHRKRHAKLCVTCPLLVFRFPPATDHLIRLTHKLECNRRAAILRMAKAPLCEPEPQERLPRSGRRETDQKGKSFSVMPSMVLGSFSRPAFFSGFVSTRGGFSPSIFPMFNESTTSPDAGLSTLILRR